MWDWLFPQKVAEVVSAKNGRLQVRKTRGRPTIWSQNYEQSGPLVQKTWQRALQNIGLPPVPRILVLGLGAGSILFEIKKRWQDARVVGVDFDPEILRLGKIYFGLGRQSGVQIVEAEAGEFLRRANESREKFDLIIVDLYCDGEYPKAFQSGEIMQLIAGILTQNGLVIFNRLKPKTTKSELQNFLDNLQRFFTIRVTTKDYNSLIICSREKSVPNSS